MVTRYNQSKERSAEVLRAVPRFMGQHAACCNPITFGVWYKYADTTPADRDGSWSEFTCAE